jgi:hypothetical protein
MELQMRKGMMIRAKHDHEIGMDMEGSQMSE